MCRITKEHLKTNEWIMKMRCNGRVWLAPGLTGAWKTSLVQEVFTVKLNFVPVFHCENLFEPRRFLRTCQFQAPMRLHLYGVFAVATKQVIPIKHTGLNHSSTADRHFNPIFYCTYQIDRQCDSTITSIIPPFSNVGIIILYWGAICLFRKKEAMFDHF